MHLSDQPVRELFRECEATNELYEFKEGALGLFQSSLRVALDLSQHSDS